MVESCCRDLENLTRELSMRFFLYPTTRGALLAVVVTKLSRRPAPLTVSGASLLNDGPIIPLGV